MVRDVGRLKVGWGGGEGKGTGCAIQNKQIVIVLSQNLRRKNKTAGEFARCIY